MVAFLQDVAGIGLDPGVGLGRAVSAFTRREDGWFKPHWVEVGAGVALPGWAIAQHNLVVVSGRGCRAGCLLVGVRDEGKIDAGGGGRGGSGWREL